MDIVQVLLCLLFAASIDAGQILFKLAATSMVRVEDSFISNLMSSPSRGSRSDGMASRRSCGSTS